MAEFRSELSVPVNKDRINFEDRQKVIMSDIEREMEERRRQWENEVERTRREFFNKAPGITMVLPDSASDRGTTRSCTGNFPTTMSDDTQTWYEDGTNGQPLWKARFSVQDFVLEDIKVIVNPDRTLVVQAKAEKRDGGSVVSKEFSRQLTLPRDVVIEKMTSLLSSDGVLTVEAPVTSPEYGSISQPCLTAEAAPSSTFTPVAGSMQSISNSGTCQQSSSRFESSSPSSQRTASPRLQVSRAACGSPRTTTANFGATSSLTQQPVIGTNLYAAAPSRGVVAVNANGEQVMQWSFNLESNLYSAEEINVRVRNNNKMSVSAVHEERQGGRTSRHEFTRECDLPETVDVRTLTTFYRPDQGVLHVEAKLLPEHQTAIDQRNRGMKLPISFD